MLNKFFSWLIILVVCLSFVSLPGCATLGGNNPNQTSLDYFHRYEHILRLGVQVAVISILDKNPAYTDRIVSFTDYIKEYIEGEEILNLRELEDVVRDKINWDDFEPTERLLIEALISQIRVEIENVLKANKIELPTPTEDVKMITESFVTWVQEGAKVFIEQRKNRSIVPVLPPRNT